MIFENLNGPDQSIHLKALVYGESGTGKTSFGVTAPKPLILLSEKQARPHIIAAARRQGIDVPPVLIMEGIEDYRAVMHALRGSKDRPFTVGMDGRVIYQGEWPESVVIDSLTDACQLVSDEIDRISPPRIAKDGLPQKPERYWNELGDRAARLIRAFRDLPVHVLFLCLLDRRETGKDDNRQVWIGPQLPMKKMRGVVQAAVNVVGVTFRRRAKQLDEDGNRPIVYGIATSGPDYMQLKPFEPLLPNEVTDFASWVARVNGEMVGVDAPEPEQDVDEPVDEDEVTGGEESKED